MEPKEEQDTELEALEAIFGPEFHILEQASQSSGARFEIDVQDDISQNVKLKISFTHTPNYPNEPLIVVVHALEGLTTPNRKRLQDHLEALAKENAAVEMPSVFTLREAAREWLTDNVVGQPVIDKEAEAEMAKKFETFDATQTDKVEVISSKAIGSPVTVESFSEWREKFIAKKQAQKTTEQREKELNSKMTGRQLFESKTVVVTAESESFWEAEASELASGA